MNPVLKYSVLRVGIFAAILAIFWALHIMSLLAILMAAVLAFLISFLALHGVRREMIDYLDNRRKTKTKSTKAKDVDENYEDALFDDSDSSDGPDGPASNE